MFTDMHCHVIWGVDDGAETRQETFQMLDEAKKDGIDRIICTPHVFPGEVAFDSDRFERHFAEAEEYIKENHLGISLYKGSEIFYTDATPRLLRENKAYTLAGSRYVLVEFSPKDKAMDIFNALRKIASTGLVPVLAHAERYMNLSSLKQIEELKARCSAKIQINARTLTTKYPFLRRKYMDGLFEEGLVDFIATDTHSMPGRGTCMTKGMDALKERYGEEICERVMKITDILFAAPE